MNEKQQAERVAEIAIAKAIGNGVTTMGEMSVWVVRDLEEKGYMKFNETEEI